jgi:hypothetical protein
VEILMELWGIDAKAQLTGCAGELEYKQWLLQHKGVSYQKSK